MSLIDIAAIGLVFVAGIVSFSYLFDVMRYGPALARRIFPQQLIGAIAVVVAITFNSMSTASEWDSVKAAVIAGFTLVAWVGFFVLFWRRPQARQVLLNIGRPDGSSQYWLPNSILWMGLGGLVLYAGFTRTDGRATAFALAILAWSAAVINVMIDRKEVLLTEHGIRTGNIGIKWNEVKHCLWFEADRGDYYLFLHIKNRPPLLNKLVWRIPGDLQQTVNDVLVQQAPETAQALRLSTR